MSYESPIEIVRGEMKSQLENDVYSVVQSYGIKVDKDELIKALEYDRNQYQQGYADAKTELERKTGKWLPHPHEREWDVCSVCGIGCKRREYEMQFGQEREHEFSYQYCPNCGAKME